jgi:ATP-binding cassette, subfamily B, bacterial
VVSGVFTGYALFATSDVLQALFAARPTPHRVRAVLPSLVLVAAAVALRLDLTSRVELPAFDDAAFHDAMLRARDRGLFSASQVVSNVLDCVTGPAARSPSGARTLT